MNTSQSLDTKRKTYRTNMSQPICPRSWYKICHVRCTMSACSSVNKGRLSSSSRRRLLRMSNAVSSSACLFWGFDDFFFGLDGVSARPNILISFGLAAFWGASPLVSCCAFPVSFGRVLTCVDATSGASSASFVLDVCEPIASGLCLNPVRRSFLYRIYWRLLHQSMALIRAP